MKVLATFDALSEGSIHFVAGVIDEAGRSARLVVDLRDFSTGNLPLEPVAVRAAVAPSA
jgi:hypothetical protein